MTRIWEEDETCCLRGEDEPGGSLAQAVHDHVILLNLLDPLPLSSSTLEIQYPNQALIVGEKWYPKIADVFQAKFEPHQSLRYRLLWRAKVSWSNLPEAEPQ